MVQMLEEGSLDAHTRLIMNLTLSSGWMANGLIECRGLSITFGSQSITPWSEAQIAKFYELHRDKVTAETEKARIITVAKQRIEALENNRKLQTEKMAMVVEGKQRIAYVIPGCYGVAAACAYLCTCKKEVRWFCQLW